MLVTVAVAAFALIGVASSGADSYSYYYCPGGGSTYTYCPGGTTKGTLIVIKDVVNDDGGFAVASDFTMQINGIAADEGNVFPGEEAPGTTRTVQAGNYTVTETGPIGYTATLSAGCSGTIAAGQTKTCTVTNDDKTAEEQVEELEDLIDSFDVGDALETALEKDLERALEKLDTKPEQSCDSLDAFLAKVVSSAAAEQPPLTIAEAKQLVAAANNLEQTIGCYALGDPRGAGELKLLDLVERINTIGVSSGVAKDLRVKARIATLALIDGKDICKELGDLQGQIAKYLEKGQITPSQASTLDADVVDIRSTLGC